MLVKTVPCQPRKNPHLTIEGDPNPSGLTSWISRVRDHFQTVQADDARDTHAGIPGSDESIRKGRGIGSQSSQGKDTAKGNLLPGGNIQRDERGNRQDQDSQVGDNMHRGIREP